MLSDLLIMVDRRAQVARGIDQRAVEVEADDREGETHTAPPDFRSCRAKSRHL